MITKTVATLAETERLAHHIGRRLQGGEVVELVSDVGGGKTTFTRGLAKGAGSTDHVSSPTFTIANVYHCPQFTIHHMDFYRLNNQAGLMAHEFTDVLSDPGAVVVVEWSDVMRHVLPEKRLTITIVSEGEEGRLFTFTFPEALNYLVENV